MLCKFLGQLECVNVSTTFLLRCFEYMSGLKINFKKSNLFGVGVDEDLLLNWAVDLNCGVGKFPFTYLGLPVGGKSKDVKIWKNVCKKFENRLGLWENGYLSFGGKILLVNAVLTAVPTY